MKEFQFIKSSWNEILELKQEYLHSLTNYPDGFWNDLVYDANVYICTDDLVEVIGFFAIGDAWNGGNSIRAFYLRKDYLIFAQEMYSQIIVDFELVSALVTSSDEQHICLAFEKMKELNGSFDMQAYNLTYGESENPPKYDASHFSIVKENEYLEMNELTDHEWKDDCYNPNNKFYCVKDDGKILGYGSIIPQKFDILHVDIGNFVIPKYRKQGVGRSIIITLSKDAKKSGFVPSVGCWYYNSASIATLKSSGYIPTSRLFYVKFIP